MGGLHVTYEYPRTDVNRFQHGPEEIFPYSDIALTVHTLRLLSIAFGVITLIFVYKIAQLVFHNHNWLPLYTTAFVSLIPMFLSINAVLNSDVLLWTLFTIALFFLLKFVNEPNRIRFVILTAVFATLAISTKSNGLVFIPIFLSVIAYLFISKQIRIQSLVKNIFLYGIFSVISISWLWVFRVLKNIDYNNAPIMDILYTAFGFRLDIGLASMAPPGILNTGTGFGFSLSRLYDVQLISSAFLHTVSGGFWWHSVWLPHIYYIIIDIFLVISVIGLIIFLIRRHDVISKLELKKNHLFILTLSILLPLGYMYINFLQTEIGIARYYFLIISMLGIVIPLGWYTFVYNKKKLQFLMFFPLVFLILFNIQVLIVMGEEQNINLFQDNDLDGISDDLDTKPNEFSNDFNNKYYDSKTFGNITTRSNQTLSVFNDLKYNGISITSPFFNEVEYSEITACHDSISFGTADTLVFSCKGGELNIIKHVKFANFFLNLNDGDLIQEEGKANAYLLQNKTKRYIDNPNVFNELGFKVNMIKIIPNEIIDKIPDGKSIVNINDL